MASSCAIIGGGMLGQTLALRLSERGMRVTIYEAADHLGGLADAWKLTPREHDAGQPATPITWDRHYHVTLLSDLRLRKLLADLELENELVWGQTKTGFYAGGRLHSMSNSWEFLRFPPLNLLDKTRLAWTISHASRIPDASSLDNVPVEAWLRKHSGNRVFERIWLPLLRSKLGEAYKTTSAAFIWATINRMYAARNSGLKREMFGYVRGGYASVLERLRTVLIARGVTTRLSAPVQRVERIGDEVTVETVADRNTFDRVVFTVSPQLASRACPQLSPAEHQQYRDVNMLGVVCVSMLLRRPLGGFYVTNITDEGFPFTGVIEMTALVDPDQFNGYTLVYLPRYLPSDDDQFTASDESIQDRFVRGLKRMYPSLKEEDFVACRVSRSRQVMALPETGFADRVPPVETSIPSVYLVSSAQILNNTLNVNATIEWAEACVDKVCTAVSPISQSYRFLSSGHEQTAGELVARS